MRLSFKIKETSYNKTFTIHIFEFTGNFIENIITKSVPNCENKQFQIMRTKCTRSSLLT